MKALHGHVGLDYDCYCVIFLPVQGDGSEKRSLLGAQRPAREREVHLRCRQSRKGKLIRSLRVRKEGRKEANVL